MINRNWVDHRQDSERKVSFERWRNKARRAAVFWLQSSVPCIHKSLAALYRCTSLSSYVHGQRPRIDTKSQRAPGHTGAISTNI